MRTRRHLSSSDPVPHESGHRSVLLHESLESLKLEKNDIVLDATLGGAGHAKEIAKHLTSKGILLGIDADGDAIKRAEKALKGAKAKVILIEGNFRKLESYLGKHVIPHLDKALFDLGWSQFQLSAGRGFSFLMDEPLLMTYSDSKGDDVLTAGRIVNTWGESSIADIIYGWGEERYSRRIAKAIIEARKLGEITSARELARIVSNAVPHFYRKSHLHPATKTFQALRIATNDEMGALKDGLTSAWKSLKSGGRLAVISFHSVEDRVVKHVMRSWVDAGEGKLLFKKPVTPSDEELQENPRARSAKLRCIQKS
jgi:16S rRNA (cytosine1402-N4)-methyltransferase